MARFTIYSKDGQIRRYEGEPQYSGSYMGVDFVEFRTISSPTPIEWQIGDYVDYYRTGKRYKLYSLPMPKKVARKGDYGASFEYSNVQLHGATKELEITPFRDLVPKDNKIHFSTRPDVSTYEDVYGIARRIQECIDDIFPNRWRIKVYDTDDADLLALFGETKEYSVSNGSCLDALSQIYDTWKNVGWIHTYDSANEVDVITIGRANVRDVENTSDAFMYGIGKGLTSIKKASANEGEFATRLYVYGSERNIQTRYYNGLDILNKDSVDIRNLMLPIEKWGKTDGLPDARKAYLQADDSIIEKYGLIPRTVYFDGTDNEEIYPSIKGLTMVQVRQAMIAAGEEDSEYLPTAHIHRIDKIEESYSSSFDDGSKEQTEKNMTFRLGLYQMGFNIADQGKLTSEGFATISMKSGACAGRDFKVRRYADITYEKVDGSKCLIYEVERNWDESLGMGFPNKTYPINDGDEFVLLDIPMPGFYIDLAEDSLFDAGEKMLADYTRVSAFYEPSVDAIKIKAGGRLLQAGMFMQVYDEDIIDTADNKDYVLIDTLTIDEKSDLPIYKVTLREQKRSARTYSALEDMIEDAKEANKQEINRVRQYTDRRFRSTQETLEMLQAAFSNFSDGIDPVTIKTMATLVGDESLQYKFTAALNSLTDIACPLYYDEPTKQMKSTPAYLKHMTLGIKEITTGTLSASSYMTWNIPAWASAVLEDGAKSYYVYVKASKSDSTSECLLSETPIGMEDVSGYYHFLVGILNSEHSGSRDFVTLYGFTEILPGQITTDILRSGNGKLIIDLARAIITAKEGAVIEGDIYIGTASKGLENLQEWSGKQQQINKAQTDAATAQGLALNAQNMANEASQRLNEWASDGIISPVEKQALKNELATVNADYSDIELQYQKYIQEFDTFILTDGKYYVTEDGYVFNVETANANWSAFNTAYDDYVAVLNSKINAEGSVEVGDLSTKQAEYYGARTAMLEDISLSIKAEADYSKQTAQEAKETANLVDAATKTLDTKISDIETGVNESVAEINARLDGVVENYFEEGVPTTSNYPASEWTTEEEKANHVGDTYTNILSFDDDPNNAGKSWRWTYTDTEHTGYHWHPIADSDAVKALLEASKAQATADGKSRNFVSQPVPPYSVGDLWIQGPDGDTMRCVNSRETGSYTASDWELASKYTDDTVAKNALAKADNAQNTANSAVSKLNEWASDNVISPTEKEGLRTELAFILGDYNEIEKNYIKYIQEFDTLILQDGNQYITVDGFVFNVESANTNWQAYENAYLAYKSDLEAKTATNDTVAIGTLKETQTEYYNKRALVLEDITLAIKAEADYATEQSRAAKKEAEEAKAEIADYEYLKNALGKSLAVEGVVMSQMVAVADVENAEDVTEADVVAFLNGSKEYKDEEHGKLILAGGIPKSTEGGSTDPKARAKEAATRIYEDGTEYTHKLFLRGGCKIGDDLIIETFKEQIEGGDTEWEEDDVFIESAIIKSTQYDNSYGASFSKTGIVIFGKSHDNRATTCDLTNGCSGYAAFFGISENEIPYSYCIIRDKPVAIEIDAPDAYGISLSRGQIAGLRPKVRMITASSTSSERTLTEFDHTILVTALSGTETIYLPEQPQEGQRYEIYTIHAEMDLTIDFKGQNVYSITQETDYNGSNANFTNNQRRHITLIYAGEKWWMTYVYLTS